jgi:phosphohistidine swiveling domain-containing protein
MANKIFLSSAEAVKVDENLLGGKAKNLAWLSRQGLPVPRWWVLTTESFTQQLAALKIADWVQEELAKLSVSKDGEKQTVDNEVIAQVASNIQQAIGKLPLTDEIKQQIRENLDSDVLTNTSLAIRSSVVGEDAEGASFAGQMDSYLYQQGEEAIFASIIKVMQSAFNHRALAYRIHKGLDIADIRAAIIIQEMVDADVAGVMFTANPATGNRRQAMISSTWGCGEGIVSGACNTDETVVGLFDDEIDTQINNKDTSFVFDQQSSHGAKEVAVDEAKRNIACLENRQVLTLRNLGLEIAKTYQIPQDIEWCLKDDQFYILQARPVTTLPPINSDQDDVVVWDNSNIQESYCGVTTPLTFSFANRAYKTVYEQTMRLLGVNESVVQAHQGMLENMLGLIHGRVYYNINNWYRGLLFLPSFKTNKSDMERMMGLTDPVDLIQDQELSTKDKLKKVPQIMRALFAMMSRFRKMDQLVHEFRELFQQEYKSVDRQTLHTLTIGQLISESRRLDKSLLENWTTPIVNDFYVMMMNGRVHRWLEKIAVENPEVVQNNLLSGEEGIESTEPTKYLLRMCDYLRQNSKTQSLVLGSENSVLLGLIQTQDLDFYQQCQEYIELYGDRTMGELKLESITLRQDASFMFAILKNFLAKSDLTLATLAENEARFRGEAEEAVIPVIKKQLGNRSLKKFNKDLSALRDAIRNRENMRLARTRMFGLYRDIYSEIGEQLAFYGQLNEARDIFYLSLEEIYAYKDGRAVQTQLQPLVDSRKEEFASYEAEDLPHHFWTKGAVYCNNEFEYPHQDEDVDLNASQLKGTGCYPGIVEEKIRLIFSPEDELSLDGQILCTVRTDPGWAPLFPTAGGIIVERGSTLSHSAVVARELGIPAIVGVPELTKILQDQEVVRMNGTTGKIERLNLDDETSGIESENKGSDNKESENKETESE